MTTMQSISYEVLLEKYAKGGETTHAQVYERVARALASVEKEADRAEWTEEFRSAMEGGFIGTNIEQCSLPACIERTERALSLPARPEIRT